MKGKEKRREQHDRKEINVRRRDFNLQKVRRRWVFSEGCGRTKMKDEG